LADLDGLRDEVGVADKVLLDHVRGELVERPPRRLRGLSSHPLVLSVLPRGMF